MRRCPRLLLALALAACGAPEIVLPVPTPERATVALDADAIAAIGRILMIEDHRELRTDELTELARHPEAEVRRRAVTAFGRIGDLAAVPLLAETLRRDASAAVRADAAFALGIIGDTSAATVRTLRGAVPARWTPVRPEETTVVVEVVGALGRIGTTAALAEIKDALLSTYPGRDEHSRRIAAEALLAMYNFPRGSRRVGAVARFLDVPDPALRWRAAWALFRLREPDASARLVRVLDDPNHRVRAFAARGLAAPLADSAGVRDTAVAGLTGALRDEHPHVRINALGALATYGDDAPADVMAGLLRDRDPNVAVAAAAAMARLEGRGADHLAAIADSAAAHPGIRGAAAAALAASDPVRARRIVEAWPERPWELRYQAARALGALGEEHAVDLFERLVRDGERRVGVAAIESMPIPADSVDPAGRARIVATLTELASASDPVIARAALSRTPRPLRPRQPAAPESSLSTDPDFYHAVARDYVAGPLAGGRLPRAIIRTAGAAIQLELASVEAPLTVRNFVALAESGYFDGGVWHRVVPNFVLQDGAPGGSSGGGPGWTIRDEINRLRYDRGVLGMALSGPDTGGSQWFITHSPQPHLDRGYTIFGRVVGGMGVADRVVQGDAIEWIRIRR